MILYYMCLVFMTMMGAVASMFLKKASDASELKTLLVNRNLYIGTILYLFSALINIWLLRNLDYSVVLPLTSLTYIWTMVLSRVFLDEYITAKKAVGVVLIILGAVLVSI